MSNGEVLQRIGLLIEGYEEGALSISDVNKGITQILPRDNKVLVTKVQALLDELGYELEEYDEEEV